MTSQICAFESTARARSIGNGPPTNLGLSNYRATHFVVRYEVRRSAAVVVVVAAITAAHNFVIFLCACAPPHFSCARPLTRSQLSRSLLLLLLHWLVSRDTFIRARLCCERGQIAQVDLAT